MMEPTGNVLAAEMLYQPRLRFTCTLLATSCTSAISRVFTTKTSLPIEMLAALGLVWLLCRSTVSVLLLTLVIAMTSKMLAVSVSTMM